VNKTICEDRTSTCNSFLKEKKSDSVIKTIDSSVKKPKTHHRTSSMEMNMEKLKPKTKNISQMKEMIYNNASKKSNENLPTNSHQNIVLNQNGQPCFNNFNIYTTHTNNKSEVNLRNYIFNKVNPQKKKGHVRSISNL
jgi:hypothetical protein